MATARIKVHASHVEQQSDISEGFSMQVPNLQTRWTYVHHPMPGSGYFRAPGEERFWGGGGDWCGQVWKPSFLPIVSFNLKDAMCQNVCTGQGLHGGFLSGAETQTQQEPSSSKHRQGTLYQFLPPFRRSSANPPPPEFCLTTQHLLGGGGGSDTPHPPASDPATHHPPPPLK